MPENLLSPSDIRLFGRVLAGVKLDYAPRAARGRPKQSPNLSAELGCNKFLRGQLECGGACLARIYAMTYEGSFYNLPKPAIFLVHGPGTPIRSAGTFAPPGNPLVNPPVMDDSGMAARDFVWESDVKYWQYDKSDMSLRMDVISGTLEEILLDATLSATSKYAITSRVDLAARVDLASRTDAGRTDLASRVDLVARHRLRS